jgi:hypothetical protein
MADLPNLNIIIENTLIELCNHHKIDIKDLKKGDIQYIVHKPSGRNYYLILNRLCYEEVIDFEDSKMIVRLVPAQHFFNTRS